MEVTKEEADRIQVACYLQRPFSDHVGVTKPDVDIILDEGLGGRTNHNKVIDEKNDNYHPSVFDTEWECLSRETGSVLAGG